MGKIVMSQKELKHYRLAMDVIEGKLSIVDFSFQIGKSYRQAQRIIKNIKDKGAHGALHGNTNKTPHNKIPIHIELKVIDLLRHKYKNFYLTHFREKISELEDLHLKKVT